MLLLLALSLGATLGTDAALRRSARETQGNIVAGSIWFAAFRTHRPADARPWLHVRLTDTTEIWGYVGDYTPEQDLADRELLIRGPGLTMRRPDSTEKTELPTWSFVAVRGSDIAWLKVRYVTDADGSVVPAQYPAARTIRRSRSDSATRRGVTRPKRKTAKIGRWGQRRDG